MNCTIRYDSEANAAYIGIGAIRDVARTVRAGDDEEVVIDLDANGQVCGIELLGIDEPLLFITRGDQRKPERTIRVKGDLL